MTGALKHSMHTTQVSKIFNVLPNKIFSFQLHDSKKNITHYKLNKVFQMGSILKFRSLHLYTIIIVTKIKKGFLKKKERVKRFFVFMTMLSFKQFESNCSKKEPCNHCLNFEYHNYGITIFSIRTQNGCTHSTHKK